MANWLKKADTEENVKSGATEKDSAELLAARERIRLREQEAEVMRPGVACLPGRQPKLMCPLVRELAVNPVPVTVTPGPSRRERSVRGNGCWVSKQVPY